MCVCVFTHRYTVGLDSQNDFLHIHHTVSLQTQDDMDTVPLPEHIKASFKTFIISCLPAVSNYLILLGFSSLYLLL